MDKRFFLLLLLIAILWGSASEGAARRQQPDRSVYVVTRNHYSEGITRSGPTARIGDLIMISISRPGSRTGGDIVYEVGQRYALFVGGQRKGDVRIDRVTPFQCNSSVAVVSTDPSVLFSTNSTGLAITHPEGILSRANVQRNANAAERAEASQLAMQEFRRHGVAGELAGNIEIASLVAIELDGSGQKTLIGSLSVKASGAQHEVFLIGKLAGSKLSAQFSRYHKTTDLDDGKDSQHVRFIDHLDLDQDGTDEVVIEAGGYESLEFWIYKRQNESWQQAWAGGSSGC